jgi:hypothetical protein
MMKIVKPAQAKTKVIPGNSQCANILFRKFIGLQPRKHIVASERFNLQTWSCLRAAYGQLLIAFHFAGCRFLSQKMRAFVSGDGVLRLRAIVPEASLARGGLTVYGAECGRFPLGPTVILDW